MDGSSLTVWSDGSSFEGEQLRLSAPEFKISIPRPPDPGFISATGSLQGWKSAHLSDSPHVAQHEGIPHSAVT